MNLSWNDEFEAFSLSEMPGFDHFRHRAITPEVIKDAATKAEQLASENGYQLMSILNSVFLFRRNRQ